MPNTRDDRFFAKVALNEPDVCWPWLGSRHPREGYGYFRSRLGGQVYAHRYAYEMWIGPIPDGQNVLHRCDYPPCCNPDHLFLGTQKDNIHDMIKKGRFVGNLRKVADRA